MEENNTSIFTQAKIEYTQQLIDVLTPNMFDGVKSIYDESKVVFSTQTNNSILTLFRKFLEKVPEWNNELVEVETERIINQSHCDWLDDLVTAVFISHTKILTSIGPNMKNTRVNLTIPKTINFIHKCYINLAREIWKNPYLYDENVSGSEYQKNMRTIELIIKENIENTIRKLLPVKEILKDHLDNFDNNELENRRRLENQSIQTALLNEIRSLKTSINSDNLSQSDNSDVNQTLTDDDNDVDEENNSPVDNKEIISDSPKNNLEVEENTIVSKPVVEEYVSNAKEGYESPDETEITKACNEVEIVSGVPDITAPTQDNTPTDNTTVAEVKYDNVEIIDPNKTNSDLMESFKNNLENLNSQEIEKPVSDILSPRKTAIEIENISKPILQVSKIKEPEEIKVEKLDMDPPPIIYPKPIEDPLIKGVLMNNPPKKDNNIKEITIVKKDDTQSNLGSIGEGSETKSEPLKPFNAEEKEKELKEIISVEVTNDDTETVDNFVNDISRLMEQKGLDVEKTPKKYTLFDDAAENE
jgi:hypothetical protein